MIEFWFKIIPKHTIFSIIKTINSKALADATVRETPTKKVPQNNNTNYWSNIEDTTYAEIMDNYFQNCESIIY